MPVVLHSFFLLKQNCRGTEEAGSPLLTNKNLWDPLSKKVCCHTFQTDCARVIYANHAEMTCRSHALLTEIGWVYFFLGITATKYLKNKILE